MGRLGSNKRPELDSAAKTPAAGPRAHAAAVPANDSMGFVDRVLVTLTGARQLIVLILLAIAFMTVISGKPLDGLLITVIATALAWDAGMRARAAALAAARVAAAAAAGLAQPDGSPPAGDGQGRAAAVEADRVSAWRPRTGRPRPRILALGVVGAVSYAFITGSFTRYSWPATAGVVGLGSAGVLVGWGGPIRQRSIPGKIARTGVIAWGSLLVFGGLWELAALLGQPNITTSSYAHPTISTLTDPLLAATPGRAVALLIWIAAGWWLIER